MYGNNNKDSSSPTIIHGVDVTNLASIDASNRIYNNFSELSYHWEIVHTYNEAYKAHEVTGTHYPVIVALIAKFLEVSSSNVFCWWITSSIELSSYGILCSDKEDNFHYWIKPRAVDGFHPNEQENKIFYNILPSNLLLID